MDPTNNPITPQNLNQSPTIVAADADITIGNAFADIIGVAELSESPDAVYHYFVASPMYAGFGDLNTPERILFLDSIYRISLNLRNYLTSGDTVELIFSIGKEYNFEDGKISQLSMLVRELLVGKIFIKDFPTTISSKLGIDDIKAGEIANKIISKSFGPIIEDVKRIQRSKFPDKIAQIQKESQPAGLTQPGARREPARSELVEPVEPARPFPRPEVELQRPAEVRLPRPEVQLPKQEDRPRPLSEARSEGAAQGPQAVRPPAQIPPRPPLRTSEVEKLPEARPRSEDWLQKPQRPPTPRPLGEARPGGVAKLEFKVPDLSGIRIPPPTPSGQAGESLEKELEKVASIIDLRNKSKE